MTARFIYLLECECEEVQTLPIRRAFWTETEALESIPSDDRKCITCEQTIRVLAYERT